MPHIHATSTDQATRDHDSQHVAPSERARWHVSPFWRHFLDMLGMMVAGMLATGAIFVSIVGLQSWNEITIVYPTLALVSMAVGMTAPMVAWMLYKGMGRRNAFEMTLVMVLPVIPFLCLVWFNITASAECGLYCATTVITMLSLMRYRRSEYSMEM